MREYMWIVNHYGMCVFALWLSSSQHCARIDNSKVPMHARFDWDFSIIFVHASLILVCMYVCMYARALHDRPRTHMYVCAQLHAWRLLSCPFVNVYIVPACAHVLLLRWSRDSHLHIFCVCMYVYVYVCVYIYIIYIYAHIHVYTHTFTHTIMYGACVWCMYANACTAWPTSDHMLSCVYTYICRNL